MRDAGSARMAAVLGSAAAVLLLLWPVQIQPQGHYWTAVGGSLHVWLFAGLAWLVGRALKPSHRGWFLWIGLAILSAGAEGLQSQVGRSAEWSDWLYGMGGAACLCATGRWRGGRRWLPVLALSLFPLAWEMDRIRMETQAFPVLAQPGTRWSSRGWSLNGVAMTTTREEGFKLTRTSDARGLSYPGFFREPTRPDWRGIQALRVPIFWPESSPAIFAVRVDDLPGNPPYAERFQKEFTVAQGWNSVRISAQEIAQTAGGRPLRLDHVRQWGVFLVSGVSFDYFSVGTVRLDLPEERP